MSDLSRVIQGLAAGIGFIGAGAILKLREQREIEGLTTAAGIWMTAAAGVAVGLGQIGLAFLSVILTSIVLSVLGRNRASPRGLRSRDENQIPQRMSPLRPALQKTSALRFGSLPTAASAQQIDRRTQLKQRII